MPNKTKPPSLPVKRIEGRTFKVGSESMPGRTYDVDLAETGYKCSCEAGNHGRACKHVRAAIAFNEAEQVQLGLEMNGGTPPKSKSNPGRRSSRMDNLGYRFDEVTSAMQKEIRRGDEEAAVWWGTLLYDASPHYAWKRVLVTAAEDVGFASPEAVSLACSLGRAWLQCNQTSYYVSPHHIAMAIMALCRAPKSTEVEDLQNLTVELQTKGARREMPSYAIDGHTKRGREGVLSPLYVEGRWDRWYFDRHVTFNMPVNKYTELLWTMDPDSRPEEYRA